jgi:hypothetical protein
MEGDDAGRNGPGRSPTIEMEGDDAGRNGPGRSPTIEMDRAASPRLSAGFGQAPALAISSTPLPFQRNFTTLGTPIPPE